MQIIINNEIIKGEFTVNELIHHLRLNFNDPNIEVKILNDSKRYAINIVGKKDGNCVLINYPENN